MPSSASKKISVEDRLDRVFHALSDRTRRRLLRRLQSGSARVTELAAPFAMSLPAISKHLRVLEEAALIERAIDGRVHRCSLTPAGLADAQQWLDHYRGFWEERLESLARHVGDVGSPPSRPGPRRR